MLRRRSSGILMHVTSLPSKYGVGDFGPEAYRFADFLKAAGQNYWQMLPLNHTTAKTGYSPYNCSSAFAGNPLLISPDLLREEGLLRKAEVSDVRGFARMRPITTRRLPAKTGCSMRHLRDSVTMPGRLTMRSSFGSIGLGWSRSPSLLPCGGGSEAGLGAIGRPPCGTVGRGL